MPKRKFLPLTICLLLYWLCSTTFLRTNLGSPVRYINDDADRGAYFTRAMWLPEGKVPYRDIFSEYPQISTYLFGMVYLPFLKETDPDAAYIGYSAFFSLLMLYTLIALLFFLEKELPDAKKKFVWFLFLPAPLYFTFNRFDIVPALLSLLALIMAKQKHWAVAGCLLGLGALTKWYPGLLVPLVALYMFYRGESWRKILQFLLIFGFTCLLILLPTYLLGGLRALLDPYVALQSKRGYDPSAFLALMLPSMRFVMPWAKAETIKMIFFLMEFSAVPLLFFVRLDSFSKLLNGSLIAIATFMLFAPLYSPQWLLWIFPLMILLVRDKWDTALLIAYGVLTYLEFPIAYDSFGANSFEMLLMGWLNVILLILIIVQAIRRFSALPHFQTDLSTEPAARLVQQP